jgi:hypothetical protein
VLKTIAVTIVTQGDDPMSFTFILRANKDKTRYEAVVAPLGDTTTYNLKITVVDFKNQGLKKIGGKMLVLSHEGFVGASINSFWPWLLLLILLALAILWYEKRRKKNQLKYV